MRSTTILLAEDEAVDGWGFGEDSDEWAVVWKLMGADEGDGERWGEGSASSNERRW